MSDTNVAVQEQEQAPEVVTAIGKGKKKGASGNLIADVAAELENLTKQKALNMAVDLSNSIETNFFKLGGVLKVIHDHSWFEGFESFDKYVDEKFDFGWRKGRYLMEIYTRLVDKQIPWEKVAHLGWTKLRELSGLLTLENLDEWIAKAEPLTVVELKKLLKSSEGGEGAPSAKAKSDAHPMKFVLKADQVEVVQAALNKAKAEGGTEYDSVALELICAAFLGGSVAVSKPDLSAVLKDAGWEKTLATFEEVFPDVNVSITSYPGMEEAEKPVEA